MPRAKLECEGGGAGPPAGRPLRPVVDGHPGPPDPGRDPGRPLRDPQPPPLTPLPPPKMPPPPPPCLRQPGASKGAPSSLLPSTAHGAPPAMLLNGTAYWVAVGHSYVGIGRANPSTHSEGPFPKGLGNHGKGTAAQVLLSPQRFEDRRIPAAISPNSDPIRHQRAKPRALAPGLWAPRSRHRV